MIVLFMSSHLLSSSSILTLLFDWQQLWFTLLPSVRGGGIRQPMNYSFHHPIRLQIIRVEMMRQRDERWFQDENQKTGGRWCQDFKRYDYHMVQKRWLEMVNPDKRKRRIATTFRYMTRRMVMMVESMNFHQMMMWRKRRFWHLSIDS